MKWAHSKYAVFLEKDATKHYLKRRKGKSQQAKYAQRAAYRKPRMI